ncbi:MAG TPA: VOC family protein [Armatimonadota bacterium]
MENAWRGIVPELPVADMERALDYYQGALGFTLQWVYGGQFASVARDGVRLFLRRQNPPFEEVVCNFYVDDVDALYEALAASVARVLSVPEDKPWGTREFAFSDPDENLFRVHRLLEHADAAG